MGVPFDHIATRYDSIFTESAIGQLQRKQVWNYLSAVTPTLNGLDILELNCGTGEDALLFSEKGFNIVATDISEEMLKVTQQKALQYSLHHKISSQFLDLDSFNETVFNKRFDLVFSNFGGLNCINPESFQKLLQKIPAILAPGGRFIAVIMPKGCLWETFYFLLKFNFKKAFRRWTNKEVIANLHGAQVKTWYYNPQQIQEWASPTFNLVNTKPIGLALPPSYLENFFEKRKRMLMRLNSMENKLYRFSILSKFGDHYLIDLQRK